MGIVRARARDGPCVSRRRGCVAAAREDCPLQVQTWAGHLDRVVYPQARQLSPPEPQVPST